MTNFPINHEAQWPDQEGKGFHIHALGHVTSQGQLWLQVTTSTNSWGLGFTSGASAQLTSADGTIIWESGLHTAGVDAKSVFWGRSIRTDAYSNEWVPSDKLSQAVGLSFLLGHTPHDRWAEDWKKIDDGVNQAGKSLADVLALAAKVMLAVKVL
ncbi:hypothetical protein IV500_17655 [Paeniglutamicibacter antarcticus]|uniref:Uncharacterized protein n=1 Tax=Arthrobacter terrae TaxID=2935737 RepID=A0A931CUJ7_9MICC|nr:hypothetical protein [Arthrobacter terrae]MBG0741196.1 hypothetical protein [Arthrobacter terrae]